MCRSRALWLEWLHFRSTCACSHQKIRAQMTVSDLVADEIARIWAVLDGDGEGEIERREINALGTIVGVPLKVR